MQIFTLKIDTEKELKRPPKLTTKVPKVGPLGVRRASLRRRRFAIWLLYLKRLTPAGVGGLFNAFGSPFGSVLAQIGRAHV